MKTISAIIFATCILSWSGQASADDYVQGYVRKDGTYVQPHYRTSPDRNPYNNYSNENNFNPYTGKQGTVSNMPTYRPQPVPSVPDSWRSGLEPLPSPQLYKGGR